MQAPPKGGLRQGRGFILGSLAFGHGVSHLYDMGFPIFMPAISASMGLSYLQVATILGIRQAGFGVVNLGGGVLVDRLKKQWGFILTGCMVWSALAFLLIALSRDFPVLVIGIVLLSLPGALWHLPATAALSQRFPDRRGFAVSIHGFGSNIGNVLGPLLAGFLLTVLVWNTILFIYVVPALVLAAFVWWSLKDLGRDAGADAGAAGSESQIDGLGAQFREGARLLKNPIVLGLVVSATLRGIGLNATFHWAPFYLEEQLGMDPFRAGVHYALLTGMGIASAPVLGALSDKYGRKIVLVPGMILASIFSFAIDREVLPSSFVNPIEATGLRRFVEQIRHVGAVVAQPSREDIGANAVDQLERSICPVVAELQRAIDGVDVVGDFGHQIGGIGQRLGQHGPGEPAAFVAVFDQRRQPARLRCVETLERRALGRRVLAGFQVDRFLDASAGIGVQPIEPADRFSPDQAAFDHVGDHRNLSANPVIGVVLGQCGGEVAVDQRQQVETDQVQQAEHAGLGNAERAAHHAVGLLDRQAAVDGLGFAITFV